jgi:gamma-glutamyltranspeptidase / glutathione hydrolase
MTPTLIFRSVVLILGLLCSDVFAGGPVRDSDIFFDSFGTAAVAADHPTASSAGAQMLAKGGNAVDAAVAASFALSVVRPYSCGIGGGGFMVIYLPNDPTHGRVVKAINYRETSPRSSDIYKAGISMKNGRYAVAVPGTVAGLLHVLESYGTLDRATVLQPAIDAAMEGFVVDDHYMNAVSGIVDRYRKNPALQDSHMGMPWAKFTLWGQVKLGDRIRNPEQARAMELIVRDGLVAFTQGEIGQAIVNATSPDRITKRTPEGIKLDDLAGYAPIEMEPIEALVAGKRLIGMPPPSSGGVTMFEALKIMEALGYDFESKERTTDRVVMLIESLKHAFADRSRYLADPMFTDVPVDLLLDPENIHELASVINMHGQDPDFYGTKLEEGDTHPIEDDGGTSHVSVIDPFGGAVAMTETINLAFGSLVGVEEFGFCLNNEMDDFTNPRKVGKGNAFGLVQSERNVPEVGKRPLSSMSPTIVLDEDGNVLAIAGASGGPRIITGTMQVLLNVMGGMDAGEAVARPRLHNQWLPNETDFEAGFYVNVLNVLRNPLRGYGQTFGNEDAVVGNVQIIVREEEGWQAASDPRKGGRPSGLD